MAQIVIGLIISARRDPIIGQFLYALIGALGEIQIGQSVRIGGLRLPQIRAIQFSEHITCANSGANRGNRANYPPRNR